jgi:O-antigen/teichoic acid export membrane protein
MKVSILLHWTMAVLSFAFIKCWHAPPVAAWLLFIGMVLAIAVAFAWRFLQGKWRDIRVVHPGPRPIAPVEVSAGPPDAL